MRVCARPGVTTRELDEIGGRVFAWAGARSGPQLDYGFPGVNCISVNDEAVHGIPSKRRLRNGDLVKLDVTAELDGFYADACVSVAVGDAAPSTRKLAAASRAALNRALASARAGVPINHVGHTIQTAVAAQGYSVCPDLMGHSIGRRIHEPPNIPNYDAPGFDQPLTEGLVITIEPIIAAGNGAVYTTRDGWTIKTQDGSYAAHTEHSVVITAGAPLILTA
jgi:methionyl aminopeptidase